MAEKDLKALFVHQLKDTYFAENAILKALLAWAKQLGLSEAGGLLQETLVEEENTVELLSDLAEDAINPAALQPSSSMIPARQC
jgi:ferritin-like metal-binding protein YciE